MGKNCGIFGGGCLCILAVYIVGRAISGRDSSNEEIEIEIQDSVAQIDVKGMHRKIELPTIYIDGGNDVSNLIMEQIYNEIIPEDFGQYYPGIVEEEIQYEIEIINEKIMSVHFFGCTDYWGSYVDRDKGLNFDLQTGRAIALSDYYTLSDAKRIIEKAREEDGINVDIPLTEAGIEKEIDHFVQLFDSEEYISRTDVFFLRDNHVCFIVPCGGSMKGSMYVELRMDQFSKLQETDSI